MIRIYIVVALSVSLVSPNAAFGDEIDYRVKDRVIQFCNSNLLNLDPSPLSIFEAANVCNDFILADQHRVNFALHMVCGAWNKKEKARFWAEIEKYVKGNEQATTSNKERHFHVLPGAIKRPKPCLPKHLDRKIDFRAAVAAMKDAPFLDWPSKKKIADNK